MFHFLSSTPARILTAVLLLQAMTFYGMSRTEPVRAVSPLKDFPTEFAGWKLVQEGVIEKEVMEVLKADDVLSRWYGNQTNKEMASLFIAHFTTQRTGKAPHSPKNCLPGSGWMPTLNDQIRVDIPGSDIPLEANRYIVARGEDRSLVIYWYQTRHRTVASEYWAKIYTVLDSIRYNRSDTAIVKVTIPLQRGKSEEEITEVARQIIRGFFDKLAPLFPA